MGVLDKGINGRWLPLSRGNAALRAPPWDVPEIAKRGCGSDRQPPRFSVAISGGASARGSL